MEQRGSDEYQKHVGKWPLLGEKMEKMDLWQARKDRFLYLLIGPFTQALVHHDRKCAFVLRELIMDMSSNYAALEVGLWSFTLCNAL